MSSERYTVGVSVLIRAWDRIEELERALKYCQDDKEVMQNIIDVHEAAPNDSPTDILNKNYERLGMKSALAVENKYGRHGGFGYIRE